MMRVRNLHVQAFVPAAFIFTVGCAASNQPPSGTGDDVGAGDRATAGDSGPPATAAELLRAMCGYKDRCRDVYGLLFASAADCRAYQSEPTLHDTLGLAACIAAFDGASCQYDLYKLIDWPAACDAVLYGTAIAGQSCQADNFVCDPATAFCRQTMLWIGEQPCDVCAPRVAATASCQETYSCQRGYICRSLTADFNDKHCEPADGMSDAGEHCRTPFDCKGALGCEGQRCVQQLAEGANCPTPNATVGNRCAWPLACVGGTCTRLSEPRLQGAPCHPNPLPFAQCAAGLACTCTTMDACNSPGFAGWTCGLLLQEGELCPGGLMSLWNNPCAPGLYCAQDGMGDAHCLPFAALSDSCTDAQCDPAEAYCDYAPTFSCLALKDLTDACSDNFECHTSNCIGGACVDEQACVMP